ncbi:hypothetical protein [Aeromicrobium sp.]|uniref:hypothetical protein n=1 Tax=Aeromicrobium sp. TaxID=1871063 RepID=UPI003C6F3D12
MSTRKHRSITCQLARRGARRTRADQEYLTAGDVFTSHLIESWFEYKRTEEIAPGQPRPHHTSSSCTTTSIAVGVTRGAEVLRVTLGAPGGAMAAWSSPG